VAGVIISSLILLVWALILILFFVIGLSAFGVAVSHTT
jgi:cell division protein FtsL